MSLARRLILLASFLGLAVPSAAAHEGETYGKAADPAAVTAPAGALPLGGPFALVDHRGRPVSDADFRGRYMLLFFGYGSCEGICPLALETMAGIVEELGAAGDKLDPVLVTVDPQRDTSARLAEALGRIHPRLIGLTGEAEALAALRRAYKVDLQPVEIASSITASDPVRRYSHGTFFYVVGPDGEVLTILPPVLGVTRSAEIVRSYLR